jgi:hypothetical protein
VIGEIQTSLNKRKVYRKNLLGETLNRYLFSGKRTERNSAITHKGEITGITLSQKDIDSITKAFIVKLKPVEE